MRAFRGRSKRFRPRWPSATSSSTRSARRCTRAGSIRSFGRLRARGGRAAACPRTFTPSRPIPQLRSGCGSEAPTESVTQTTTGARGTGRPSRKPSMRSSWIRSDRVASTPEETTSTRTGSTATRRAAPSSRATIPARPGQRARTSGVPCSRSRSTRSSERIYAGTRFNGVVTSFDGGVTWRSPSSIPAGELRVLVADPTRPATLYAGTASGVHRSRDFGRTGCRSVKASPRSTFAPSRFRPMADSSMREPRASACSTWRSRRNLSRVSLAFRVPRACACSAIVSRSSWSLRPKAAANRRTARRIRWEIVPGISASRRSPETGRPPRSS